MESGRQKLDQEKDFYQNLDKESKGSCCTCPTLLLFFIGLFILSILLTYFLSKNLFSKNHLKTDINKISNINITEKKIKKSSQIIISDKDLQSSLFSNAGLFLPLSDKKVAIESDGIVLSGNIPGLSQQVEFVATPKVENGKIIISKSSLRSGSNEFGTEFSSLIKSKLAATINNLIKQKTDRKITEIKLNTGEMVIFTD